MLNQLTYWYRTRGRSTRVAISALAIAACLVCVGIIGYMLMVPRKVEVRYGTIVRDPVDGHVWEDNTKKAVVAEDKADKYTVTYVDKLSPEHQKQQEEQQAQQAAEEAQLAQLQGVEKLGIPMTSQQLINLRIILESADVTGVNVVQGIELSNALSQTRTKLINYRNQIAGMGVTPEIASFKDRVLTIFDKYIQACDLYLQAMTEMNQSYLQQANALFNEATAMIPRPSK
jgi:hypothetical protein